MKHTIAALTLSLLAVPALAQAKEAPTSLTPSTDAAVTYAVQATGQPSGTMIIAWNVGAGKVRIDSAMFPGWLLLEQRDQRAFMVVEEQRAYMPLPAEAAAKAAPRLPPGVQLTEAGTDTVASQPCTIWKFASQQEGEGTVCVTDGSLLLRLEARTPAGQQVRIEAQTVSTSAQDTARFTLPAGFRNMQQAQGQPQGQGQGQGQSQPRPAR